MTDSEEVASAGRVTRSLRKRLVSTDSLDAVSRNTTPVPKLGAVAEIMDSPLSIRKSRRNSTVTPVSTPLKAKNIISVNTSEANSSAKRTTRRRSVSNTPIPEQVTQHAVKELNFESVPEEDVKTIAAETKNSRIIDSTSKISIKEGPESSQNPMRKKPGRKPKKIDLDKGGTDSEVEVILLERDDNSKEKQRQSIIEVLDSPKPVESTTAEEEEDMKENDLVQNTSTVNIENKNNKDGFAVTENVEDLSSENESSTKQIQKNNDERSPIIKNIKDSSLKETSSGQMENKNDSGRSPFTKNMKDHSFKNVSPGQSGIKNNNGRSPITENIKDNSLMGTSTGKIGNKNGSGRSPITENAEPFVKESSKEISESGVHSNTSLSKPDKKQDSKLAAGKSQTIANDLNDSSQTTTSRDVAQGVSNDISANEKNAKATSNPKILEVLELRSLTPTTIAKYMKNSLNKSTRSENSKIVNFDTSEDNDTIKSTYPKTPGNKKSRSQIDMHFSKELDTSDISFQSDGAHLKDVKGEVSEEEYIPDTQDNALNQARESDSGSNVDFKIGENKVDVKEQKDTPLKAKSLLSNVKSSTPITDSCSVLKHPNSNFTPKDATDDSNRKTVKASPISIKSRSTSEENKSLYADGKNTLLSFVETLNSSTKAFPANLEDNTNNNSNQNMSGTTENGNIKSPFASSWSQCVNNVNNSNSKIDTIVKEDLIPEKNAENNVVEKSEEFFKRKTTSKASNKHEESERVQADAEDEEELDVNEEPYEKNSFIDDEPIEAMNYHSGDSMDEDERNEIKENEIIEEGESLGSKDSTEEESDDEENDSFIVSDDDEHLNDSTQNERKELKRLSKTAEIIESDSERVSWSEAFPMEVTTLNHDGNGSPLNDASLILKYDSNSEDSSSDESKSQLNASNGKKKLRVNKSNKKPINRSFQKRKKYVSESSGDDDEAEDKTDTNKLQRHENSTKKFEGNKNKDSQISTNETMQKKLSSMQKDSDVANTPDSIIATNYSSESDYENDSKSTNIVIKRSSSLRVASNHSSSTDEESEEHFENGAVSKNKNKSPKLSPDHKVAGNDSSESDEEQLKNKSLEKSITPPMDSPMDSPVSPDSFSESDNENEDLEKSNSNISKVSIKATQMASPARSSKADNEKEEQLKGPSSSRTTTANCSSESDDGDEKQLENDDLKTVSSGSKIISNPSSEFGDENTKSENSSPNSCITNATKSSPCLRVAAENSSDVENEEQTVNVDLDQKAPKVSPGRKTTPDYSSETYDEIEEQGQKLQQNLSDSRSMIYETPEEYEIMEQEWTSSSNHEQQYISSEDENKLEKLVQSVPSQNSMPKKQKRQSLQLPSYTDADGNDNTKNLKRKSYCPNINTDTVALSKSFTESIHEYKRSKQETETWLSKSFSGGKSITAISPIQSETSDNEDNNELLHAANRAKLELKTNYNKSKGRLTKKMAKETKRTPTSSSSENESVMLQQSISKDKARHQETLKLAVTQALKTSAEMLLIAPGKKQGNQIFEAKQVKAQNTIEQDVKVLKPSGLRATKQALKTKIQDVKEFLAQASESTGAPRALTSNKRNKAKREAQENLQSVQKLIRTSSGVVHEMPTTPKRKERSNIKKIQHLTGVIREEAITPPAKKAKQQRGFRESSVTPRNIGFKVRRLLTAGQDDVPTVSSHQNQSKRKRFDVEEPKRALPQPQWSQSGVFWEETTLPTPHVIKKAGSTEFRIASVGEKSTKKSKPSKMAPLSTASSNALNFRNRALYENNVPRETAYEVLQRKERYFMHRNF